MVLPTLRATSGARRRLVGLALLGLAGCASFAPAVGERTYQGRFALQAVAGSREDHANGRFLLTLDHGGFTLDLSSPLGNTLARVHRDAQGAQLTVPGDDSSLNGNAADLDLLIQARLGWRLPVAGLASWITGRPDPGRRFIDHAEAGFEQDDWQIRVSERFADGRPRRLELQRAAGTDGAPQMQLTLLLDEPGA